MVKGILFKYDADVTDEFLQDKGSLISDPDFISNKNPDGTVIPIWAICGWQKRQNLNLGDVVFFLPQKHKSTIQEYIFTGILVCKEKQHEKFVSADSRLTIEYRTKYKKDLESHRKTDMERRVPQAVEKRGSNVIYGEPAPTISRWFGNEPILAQPLLKKLGLIEQLNKLGIGKNPSVTEIRDEEKVRRLYEELMNRTKPSHPSKPITKSHPSDTRCGVCYD